MKLRSSLRKLLFAAMVAAPMLTLSIPQAQAGIFISVNFAPPVLPVYVQPPLPAPGYIWTPGYWAYGDAGYYWVPGVWVQPPTVGLLWTPGYWGYAGGVYGWRAGYWGPHVGFYGGVNYGHGYDGDGYRGGRWEGNSFAYNQAVTNINNNTTVVHNTYNETVINNVTVNKVSYNGPGGTTAVATPAQRQAAAEPHVPPTPLQRQHVQEAAKNPALFARANQGKPPIAATPKPAVFNAPGVIAAHGAAPMPPRPAVDAHGYPGAPPASGGQRSPVTGQPNGGQPAAARALMPPPSAVAHPPLVTARPAAPPPPPPKVVNPPPKPKTPPPKPPKDSHPEKEGEHRE